MPQNRPFMAASPQGPPRGRRIAAVAPPRASAAHGVNGATSVLFEPVRRPPQVPL